MSIQLTIGFIACLLANNYCLTTELTTPFKTATDVVKLQTTVQATNTPFLTTLTRTSDGVKLQTLKQPIGSNRTSTTPSKAKFPTTETSFPLTTVLDNVSDGNKLHTETLITNSIKISNKTTFKTTVPITEDLSKFEQQKIVANLTTTLTTAFNDVKQEPTTVLKTSIKLLTIAFNKAKLQNKTTSLAALSSNETNQQNDTFKPAEELISTTVEQMIRSPTKSYQQKFSLKLTEAQNNVSDSQNTGTTTESRSSTETNSTNSISLTPDYLPTKSSSKSTNADRIPTNSRTSIRAKILKSTKFQEFALTTKSLIKRGQSTTVKSTGDQSSELAKIAIESTTMGKAEQNFSTETNLTSDELDVVYLVRKDKIGNYNYKLLQQALVPEDILEKVPLKQWKLQQDKSRISFVMELNSNDLPSFMETLENKKDSLERGAENFYRMNYNCSDLIQLKLTFRRFYDDRYLLIEFHEPEETSGACFRKFNQRVTTLEMRKYIKYTMIIEEIFENNCLIIHIDTIIILFETDNNFLYKHRLQLAIAQLILFGLQIIGIMITLYLLPIRSINKTCESKSFRRRNSNPTGLIPLDTIGTHQPSARIYRREANCSVNITENDFFHKSYRSNSARIQRYATSSEL